MKCPHCAMSAFVNFTSRYLDSAIEGGNSVRWAAETTVCPACLRLVIWIRKNELVTGYHGQDSDGPMIQKILVWPLSTERTVPVEVPEDIRRDFTEASRVLSISAQSSAAISRRTLQQILRTYGGTKSKDLYDQIQEVINTGHLPSSLADQLHSVRVIGNFAAHPLKSQFTGAIIAVEPNEAEWNLEVLQDLFDFYFVKPSQAAARKKALNEKLAEAGKPILI